MASLAGPRAGAQADPAQRIAITLLALMGISSGTYIGFKLPARSAE